MTDLCCDKIHIVYDDFNQLDPLQPYKRYKVTYYALQLPIVMGAILDMQSINQRLVGGKHELVIQQVGQKREIGLGQTIVQNVIMLS